MKQLMSRWGEKLDREMVWKEYPRPGLVRESYLNLNGEWDYCINDSRRTEQYDGKILVPFSPEAFLSGVGRVVKPGQYLHYKKIFRLPDGFFKSRVLLHFGAVDQECEVRLNGRFAGLHKGGYLPFSFDITEMLKEGENVLTLWVKDYTEKLPHARGKQKLVKKGKFGSLFYTPQSGIWQTVWMESVEEDYIDWVKFTPMYDEGAVRIRAKAARRTTDQKRLVAVTILDQGQVVARAEGSEGKDLVIPLKDFHSWSPEDPYLYDAEIRYGEDRVSSYFGMRKVSVDRDERGILRFFLNNQPYFFNGLLDQGYWPESLMTPPDDEALLYDIKKLKEMGYNTLRKHVKVELDRFYYHCDRLGMIVWQDMPNGGGEYHMGFVTYLPNASDRFARGVKDKYYHLFGRADLEGRRQYYRDLAGMVRHLYNHPSIVAWVPFNEGWGQFDACKATEKLRKMDKGRLINEACGWFDQKGGDMHSIHNYNRPLAVKPQLNRVVALTEYGGYAYPVEGHTACEKAFGYRHYSSGEELTVHYERLWREEIYPNVDQGLSAAIYTQVSDIEEEINGVMTYDREVIKLNSETVQKLNQKLYERFENAVRNRQGID
ncbi:MAG: glycoside hydrolase family 2 [Lachnospiraceae bacterium]|jgi:beta-galactosidase/beta-glucuronidase|nr:glycoside hydrolase family 2 [Lachnospiraceae bacterium]